MKIISILLISVFLVGCAKDVIIVRVPVPMTPSKVEIPPRPILGSDSLKDTDENDIVVKTMMVDFEKLKSYAKQLEHLIETYQTDIDEFWQNKVNTEITVKQ